MDEYTILTTDDKGDKHITIVKASDLISASEYAENEHTGYFPEATKIETKAAGVRNVQI